MVLLAFSLLLTMAPGLLRMFIGPTTVDRMLGLQMTSTGGVAVLLVMAEWQRLDALRDVALIFALLAAVATAALVQMLRGGADG